MMTRRRRWHPFLFMLSVGTLGASIVAGDVPSALLALIVVLFTLGVL